MARVFLARDLKPGRDVEVLHAELTAVIGPERFLKEIELTAGLQHPVRLERERQLPVEEVVAIVGAIGRALDYAHRQGVEHRAFGTAMKFPIPIPISIPWQGS